MVLFEKSAVHLFLLCYILIFLGEVHLLLERIKTGTLTPSNPLFFWLENLFCK